MKRFYFLLTGFLFFISSNVHPQSYLGLDGGFEGTASIDNTNIQTVPQAIKWTKSNANQTIADETSIVRSGGHSLRINNISTTGRRVWSPLITASATTNITIQYYRYVADAANSQSNQEGIYTDAGEGLQGTYDTPAAGSWEKQNYTKSSTTFTSLAAVIMHKQIGTGGNMYIDDVVLYAGAFDTTHPDPPTNPIAAQGSNSGEINVSWTAPGTGVDNGGYLVLRRDGAASTGTPNVNGIYAVGNTISDGTVSYVGTNTSYTDASLTVGHTYYYTVYSYDKAYNYCSTPPSATSSQPLPVELTSFTSNVVGNKVKLNWRTATEVNNYGFEIERSQTSNVKSEMWEEIGFVQGNGNSNSPKNYSFTDQPAGGKDFKYRLKQIDFDGSFEYSFEITAKLGNVSTYKLDQNYPNPFNPFTKISYTIPQRTYVRLRVYDMLAKEVAELVNTIQESGSYEATFDGSNLPSGAYFYKLEAGNYIEVKKLLLIK